MVEQYIGLDEFCVISGLTRKSIYNKEKSDKNFPKRTKILPERRLPIYLRSEVERWSIEYCKQQKSGRPKNSGNQNTQILNHLLKELSAQAD